MQDDNNKNMILASVLSMLVLLTWFYFFPQEEYKPVTNDQNSISDNGIASAPSAGNSVASVPSIAICLALLTMSKHFLIHFNLVNVLNCKFIF